MEEIHLAGDLINILNVVSPGELVVSVYVSEDAVRQLSPHSCFYLFSTGGHDCVPCNL